MDTDLLVEALSVLGVCNLCLNEGAVKSMLVPHINMGKTEIYSQMLLNCFSIDISQTELGDTKRLICFLCIDKLRECETFRTMVQQSLNILKENAKLLKEEKVANIKEELDDIDFEDNHFDGIIHHDDDFDENAEEKVAYIKEEVGDIDIEDNNLYGIIHKDDDFDDNERKKTNAETPRFTDTQNFTEKLSKESQRSMSQMYMQVETVAGTSVTFRNVPDSSHQESQRKRKSNAERQRAYRQRQKYKNISKEKKRKTETQEFTEKLSQESQHSMSQVHMQVDRVAGTSDTVRNVPDSSEESQRKRKSNAERQRAYRQRQKYKNIQEKKRETEIQTFTEKLSQESQRSMPQIHIQVETVAGTSGTIQKVLSVQGWREN